jgi:hypothetical protein
MDLKVAFTSQDVVPDVVYALEVAQGLAERLCIAHRAAHLSRRFNRLEHGFFALSDEQVKGFTKAQREQLGIRKLHGHWYRTERGPLEQSPYYRYRLAMLEQNLGAVDSEIEALGLRLALHPNMYTFELRFISLYLSGQTVGPFVGGLMDWGQGWFPYSEIEERTGLFGPLVHMQMVEFLAALKRIAIPSLYIRDPSGYLERGDVFALLEAMNLAEMTYQDFFALIFPSLEMPEIGEKNQLIPDLSGPVGSEKRVRQLEEFLLNCQASTPDIDDLLARGR